MKLALHRSLNFWSGILIMAFICWAWRDSMNRWTYLFSDHMEASNVASTLFLAYTPNISMGLGAEQTDLAGAPGISEQARTMPFPRPDFSRQLNDDEQVILTETCKVRGRTPEGAMVEFYTSDTAGWACAIPHWLILLAVALPWTALLIWRANRRKAGSD